MRLTTVFPEEYKILKRHPSLYVDGLGTELVYIYAQLEARRWITATIPSSEEDMIEK